MKKLIAIAALALFSIGNLYALSDTGRKQNFANVPKPTIRVTEAVYLSSRVVLTPDTTTVFLSTIPVLLHGIMFSSAAVGISWVDVWNARTTTDTDAGAQIQFHIDSTNISLGMHTFNVYLSSGLGVDNQSDGGSPADITVIWQER